MSISVQNCHVSGTVETEGDRACAGGLVGYASYADFMDCSADVTVRGSGKSGGFIGEAFEGTYKDCTAKGKVDGGWSVGGFAGILFYKTQVEKCAADCRVTANDWNVGGFAGYAEESVTIRNCVAFGDGNSTVTGWQPKAGGFVGTVDGSGGACTIQNSHAAGKVSVNHATLPGHGFVSVLSGDVTLENNSFDGQKNAALSAAADGEAAGVAKENTRKVLANICRDYYDGHDWDMEHWVVDKQPTTTETGYRSHHCRRCDMAGEAEILPMLEPTPVPEPGTAAPRTGDTSPLLLWGALLLVSGTAMLWAGTRKKKA